MIELERHYQLERLAKRELRIAEQLDQAQKFSLAYESWSFLFSGGPRYEMGKVKPGSQSSKWMHPQDFHRIRCRDMQAAQ